MIQNINIVPYTDATRWNAYLQRIPQYDVYYLPSYQHLSVINGEGEPILFVYEEGEDIILFPLVIRSIPETSYYDATSVYGYTGPLASTLVRPDLIWKFNHAFSQYLQKMGIVSVFTRLHPLFVEKQKLILQNMGMLIPIGHTIAIDLSMSEEEQIAQYRKGHKYDLKKLERNAYSCVQCGADEYDSFVAMYYETMQRNNATPYYLFSKDYFKYLLTDMGDNTHLFMCHHKGRSICGGIFTVCGTIAQYHLSAVDKDFLSVAPTKLLIDTVRRWATDLHFQYLHLGSGVGGHRDSLFEFKHGFSPNELEYILWQYIAMPGIYVQLLENQCRLHDTRPSPFFFPAYRDPVFE